MRSLINFKVALLLQAMIETCQNKTRTEVETMQALPASEDKENTILALPQNSTSRRKHLAIGHYLEVELGNLNDLQYSAKLYLGSHDEARSFLLDTGSNVLWLTSELCDDKKRCDNKHSRPYRLEDSAFGKYYQEVKIGPEGGLTYYMPDRENAGSAEIRYGQGHVKGAKAVDRVCFQGQEQERGALTELCLPDQQLISVDRAQDLENLHADGVLGLSPAGSDQILTSLKASRRIQKRIFSISLDSGVLTLGGFNFERFAQKGAPSSWFPTIKVKQSNVNGTESPNAESARNRHGNETHWTLAMPSLKVNDRVQPLESQLAILDTGTSHIRVPAEDFDQLKTLLEDYSGTSCSVGDAGNLECACGLRGSISDFPSIYFNLQNYMEDSSLNEQVLSPRNSSKDLFVLTPSDYLTKLGFTCYSKLNRLPQKPQSQTQKRPSYWVLGATFLKKYYAVYDLDKSRVGLARSAYVASVQPWGPQMKYFALRVCMLLCLSYIVYDLLIVRVLQQRYRLCLRRAAARQKRRQDLAKKELIDNEAELSNLGDQEELDMGFSSDQQSSSYDDSHSNMDESDLQSGRHSDCGSSASSSSFQAQPNEQQASSCWEQGESGPVAAAGSKDEHHYQRKRKQIAQSL